MDFEYSCFLSHRVPKGALAVRIITDLHDALAQELELHLDEEVYLSEDRLHGGDFLDAALEHALYHSLCMIAIFTGKYFSRKHDYCAREYCAMEQLERRRFTLLKVRSVKQHGLIIPIVLRDHDSLPAGMKRRVWYDFQEYAPHGDDPDAIVRPQQYFAAIRKIGDYVAARYREYTSRDIAPCECNDFALPSSAEAREFMKQLYSDGGD